MKLNGVEYRITTTGEDDYCIRNVYLDKDGNIVGFDKSAAQPFGESPEELREDLEKMMEALTVPIVYLKVDIDRTGVFKALEDPEDTTSGVARPSSSDG